MWLDLKLLACRRNRSSQRRDGGAQAGGREASMEIKVLLKLEHHEAERGCEKQVTKLCLALKGPRAELGIDLLSLSGL